MIIRRERGVGMSSFHGGLGHSHGLPTAGTIRPYSCFVVGSLEQLIAMRTMEFDCQFTLSIVSSAAVEFEY